MKQLNKIESLLFIIGGLLMAAGAGLYAFFILQPLTCWVMLIGSVLFVAMQIRQEYLGRNITIRRLRRIMFLANACFVLAGIFMVEDAYRLIAPFFTNSIGGYSLYVNIFYHNWVILLLIGTVLEVYTTHRISSELEKEQKQ